MKTVECLKEHGQPSMNISISLFSISTSKSTCSDKLQSIVCMYAQV